MATLQVYFPVSTLVIVCWDGQPSQSRSERTGWLYVVFCYCLPVPERSTVWFLDSGLYKALARPSWYLLVSLRRLLLFLMYCAI